MMTSSSASQTAGFAHFDQARGAADVVGLLAHDQFADDERLEQLQRHHLRQATLVNLEFRTGHDDRTAGVVDALTEQVLAETALLAL